MIIMNLAMIKKFGINYQEVLNLSFNFRIFFKQLMVKRKKLLFIILFIVLLIMTRILLFI